jgi:tRNA dimethylallyltransferase
MATNGPLIVIVGETASGKSALALELAERYNGEIICADSRTVYKGMDIGTAKPTPEERTRVAHHILDVIEPDQTFTAADFKRLANEAIDDISLRGKLPIMVGGTGLYIDAVLFDYGFAPSDAPRNPQNPRHLDKAQPRLKQELRPNTLVLGLRLDRELLIKRVEGRVEMMIEAGFADEVRRLSKQDGWEAPALQAPGYKSFREYLGGTISLDEAKALFIKSHLQLARRQRTWFKRNKSIHWLNNGESAVEIVTTFLSK